MALGVIYLIVSAWENKGSRRLWTDKLSSLHMHMDMNCGHVFNLLVKSVGERVNRVYVFIYHPAAVQRNSILVVVRRSRLSSQRGGRMLLSF